MRKQCKRSLSIFLAILMAFLSFSIAGTMAVSAVDSTAGSKIWFYVPETIYLNPNNLATFQFYVNRANAKDGALLTGEQTSGNVFFACDNATSITNLKLVDKNNQPITATISKTNATSNYLTSTITAGHLSTPLQSGKTSLAKWIVTYAVGGKTYEATAYSTIYAPLTGKSSLIAASAHARYSSTFHGNDSICVTSWISGAHDGLVNIATPDTYSGTMTGGADLVGSYNGTLTSPVTVPTTRERSVEGLYDTTGVGGSGYWSSDGDINFTGGAGWIHVDTSRYSNLNQIPNLCFGMDDNYELGSKHDECKVNVTVQGGTPNTFSFGDRTAPARVTMNKLNVPVTGTTRKYVQVEAVGVKSTSTIRTAKASAYLYVDMVSKMALRDAVNAEISLARQSDAYTEASWSAYKNYLESAALTLGNPAAAPSAVANATNNVKLAAASLVKVENTEISNGIVKFNANGGTGYMEGVYGEMNSTITLPACTFVREGYTFTGWSENQEDNSPLYNDCDTVQVTADEMTLYAVWTKNAADPEPDPEPTETPVFRIVGGTAHAGESVDVAVEIANNPGIVASLLRLSYDSDVLTLTGVKDGGLLGTGSFVAGNDLTANPYNVLWVDALSTVNHTQNGTVVTFTFAVAEDAPVGATTITLNYDAGSTYNTDLQLVSFSLEAGTVNVTDRVAADVTGDGEIDLRDVTILRRWIVGGWDVEIIEQNADVNGDNRVNLVDVAIITRYLAGGWGVELV